MSMCVAATTFTKLNNRYFFPISQHNCSLYDGYGMKIQVKVKPNSRTEEVTQESGSFIVKVKDPPREGKANLAVVRLLAEHFSVSRSQVRILSGLRSRSKVIEVAEK